MQRGRRAGASGCRGTIYWMQDLGDCLYMRLFILSQEMVNTASLLCSDGNNVSCAAQRVAMNPSSGHKRGAAKEPRSMRSPRRDLELLQSPNNFLVNYGNPGPSKGDSHLQLHPVLTACFDTRTISSVCCFQGRFSRAHPGLSRVDFGD